MYTNKFNFCLDGISVKYVVQKIQYLDLIQAFAKMAYILKLALFHIKHMLD